VEDRDATEKYAGPRIQRLSKDARGRCSKVGSRDGYQAAKATTTVKRKDD